MRLCCSQTPEDRFSRIAAYLQSDKSIASTDKSGDVIYTGEWKDMSVFYTLKQSTQKFFVFYGGGGGGFS